MIEKKRHEELVKGLKWNCTESTESTEARNLAVPVERRKINAIDFWRREREKNSGINSRRIGIRRERDRRRVVGALGGGALLPNEGKRKKLSAFVENDKISCSIFATIFAPTLPVSQ